MACPSSGSLFVVTLRVAALDGRAPVIQERFDGTDSRPDGGRPCVARAGANHVQVLPEVRATLRRLLHATAGRTWHRGGPGLGAPSSSREGPQPQDGHMGGVREPFQQRRASKTDAPLAHRPIVDPKQPGDVHVGNFRRPSGAAPAPGARSAAQSARFGAHTPTLRVSRQAVQAAEPVGLDAAGVPRGRDQSCPGLQPPIPALNPEPRR